MTNYFGKRRLTKLFYHYIAERTELVKEFRAEVKEYGSDLIFVYSKDRGSEWLECSSDNYRFRLFAFGKKSKVVTLDEQLYDEDADKYIKIERIVSFFDKDFIPHAENKNKALDCFAIAKIATNTPATEKICLR